VDIQRTAEPTEPQILEGAASELRPLTSAPRAPPQQDRKRGADIATPAVRHMIKELNLNIRDIPGTGKDGRVRKEDIERYTAAELTIQPPSEAKAKSHPTAEDRVVSLTPTENQMLKVMTQSLSIPHFLYTHAVDVTLLNTLRTRWNSSTHSSSAPSRLSDSYSRLTALPFIMKAISQAIAEFPKVNSHLDLGTTPNKPQLILKASHSFGLAIDTPQGLLVPVVRDVQNHSIHSLAAEINRISALAHAGKLSPDDFKGATLSISNIGSIGGRVVSPVIVTPMVAIVGIGRARKVPAFQDTPDGERVLVEREEVVLSWSADHRVLDGATVAKCAERVGWMIENIDLAGLSMK
jgi:2-oxoisovalerate dehydrogenase E2 component (dihydrolipoyl transacylase)